MNQVLHAGAETAQLGVMLGFTTLIFLVAMVGWTWWAWAPSRREKMDQAALLPLHDDETPEMP